MNTKLLAIPTNVITGFLGAGKTTVILHLLKHKPTNERWAVLVNEFGEVGVDGSLIEGNHKEGQGIFIREVPGGCMCCAAGLPMQIALNQLLSRAKPDRLLIEPTGLGHPKEVLQVLSADHYQEVLDIQQCITLVDARKTSDPRYTEHQTFNQQIEMADRVIGHKTDLCSKQDQQNLVDYISERRGPDLPISFAQQGKVDLTVLTGKSSVVAKLKHNKHRHHHPAPVSIDDQPFPDTGFIKSENSGEGYQSIGWRFSPEFIFNKLPLYCWLSGLKAERGKGVFITHDGVFAYNITMDAVTEIELDDCLESRIEIINYGECQVKEEDLLQCIDS